MGRVVLAGLLVFALASPVMAQDRWDHYMRAAEYAFAYNDHDRAEQEFLKALEVAESFEPGDRRLESSLDSLGRFYEHNGRHTDAEPLFQRALAARVERLGSDSPALLDLMAALARVHAHLGRHQEAQAELERYVALADGSGGADVDQHLQVLDQLGRLYLSQSRTEEALPLQRRLAQLRQDDPRSTPDEIADALEGLGRLEAMHGSQETAEEVYVRVAELRTGDGDRIVAAEALAAAATDCVGLGATGVADRLARRALAEAATAGATDLEMLAAHQTLADAAWLGARRSTDSLTTLLEVAEPSPELDEAERRLTVVHELAPSLEGARRLAQVGALQGNVEAALRWQRQVVATRRKMGTGAAEIVGDLTELVELELRAGQDEAAVGTNGELITTLETALGEQDPRLLPPLERQLELLRGLGRKKEVKVIKRRLRAVQRAARKGR